MKDYLDQIAEEPSCCPELTFQTRMVGFIITFILGMILLFMSFGALGGLFLGAAGWFAFLYTLGNVTSLCA